VTTPARAALFAVLALACACESDPPKPRPDPAVPAKAATAQPQGPRVEFVSAGDGEVASLVKAEEPKARAEGRQLLVYVGATWCEPCQRFHRAAEKGELDAKLPPLRFLEFDLGRDETRLKSAGYGTDYIPLFVVPDAEGKGTSKRIAGSIKGPGSVDEITPRLRALLGQ
jgi:hypothetical protein